MTEAACTPSLESAFHVDAISAAYDTLLEKRTDVLTEQISMPRGWDRVSRHQFEAQKEQHFAAIQRKVLGGRYTFRPFVYVEVEKTTGGTRKIAMSTIRDRIVQGILLELLAPKVEERLMPCCHAYRRGRSVQSAVSYIHSRIRQGNRWVVESDFRDFFDNLDHDLLMTEVRTIGLEPRLEHLVFRYLRTPQMPKKGAPHPVAQARTQGVPQGGVLSGMLSNLYLAPFDASLLEEGLDLVRYADDFLILAEDERSAQAAKILAEARATERKLVLHPDKTDVHDVWSKGFDFVGFRLHGTRVSIRRANVRKFKDRVRGIIKEDVSCEKKPRPLTRRRRLIRRLNSKIQGIEVDGTPRSWIAFFRIANDHAQLRRINGWFWRALHRWHEAEMGEPLTYGSARKLGLKSLTHEYWRVRKALYTPDLPDDRAGAP